MQVDGGKWEIKTSKKVKRGVGDDEGVGPVRAEGVVAVKRGKWGGSHREGTPKLITPMIYIL